MKSKKLRIIFISYFSFLLFLTVININKIFAGINFIYLLFISVSFRLSLREIDFIQATFVLIALFVLSTIFLLVSFNILRLKFIERLINKMESINLEYFSGLILAFFMIIISLTAPVISDEPSFYKDVAITKLLPPFSKVNYVVRTNLKGSFTGLEEIKKKLFENEEKERRIYFTKIEFKDTLVIVHKNKLKETIHIKEIETVNNKPVIYSKIFFAGTDEFGRDMLSRIIHGVRISIFIGLLAVFISFLFGSVIGYSSGIIGGVVDVLLMRLVDFFLSFPILFLAIFLIAFVGNSIFLLIIVFGFSGWMYIARIARNESIACMKREFVQMLILAGQSKIKIITKHILPNTFSSILITLIFQMSNVVIAESGLSFLGLGVQPPTPTLGNIIKSGYENLSIAWWISFLSGIALITVIISFNLLAEGLKNYYHKK